MMIRMALSSARRPRSTSSVFCFHVFLSFACSLLVQRLSRQPWFVDCIHVVFCRPLGLVTGFNAICNACLTAFLNMNNFNLCLSDCLNVLSNLNKNLL